MDKIEKIIQGIWDDINDRRGFHLDSLDDDIQEEIKSSWYRIIEQILKQR